MGVNLKKVRLAVGNGEAEVIRNEDIESWLEALVKTCESLEYIELYHPMWNGVLQGLAQGLFETKERKRTKLKMWFGLLYDETFDAIKFGLSMSYVIRLLADADIEDFMLMYSLHRCEDEKVTDQ